MYASDLSRALETARAIARAHHLEVVVEPRLREFSFGAWEGLTWGEIVAFDARLRNATPTSAAQYAPHGGETFAEVAARVGAFLEDLQARPQRRIVAVTHAGALHAALAALRLGDDAAGVRLSPGGITRVAMSVEGARLVSLNEVGHLDSAG